MVVVGCGVDSDYYRCHYNCVIHVFLLVALVPIEIIQVQVVPVVAAVDVIVIVVGTIVGIVVVVTVVAVVTVGAVMQEGAIAKQKFICNINKKGDSIWNPL